MPQNILMNEEDVKNKILQPFLGALGISVDEIQYETDFSIRLGRSEYEIGKKNSARGRSDILYKKDGRNIFVVEVKSDSHDVTDEDLEQAWSYARLTQPMAAFAIATNGKQTRIIDTLSKKDLTGTNIGVESKFWTSGCTLSLDEELELRYEALRYFIGYSSDNLEAFSRSQINLRMQTLKGSVKELHKKYIPELCVDRIDITESFKEFLRSHSTCFALIGDSGVGKTNLICSLAEKIIKEHIVLFFNATDMSGDIIGNIKGDFNWFFSSQLEDVEVVRRIEELSGRGNYKICIFIDAIDEAAAPNFAQDLNDVVRKLQQFKNIKLCVTCKSLEWHGFLTSRGNPTYLAEAVYKPHTAINTDKENKIVETEPGIYVPRFNDEELQQVDNKYRGIFKYRGELTGETRNECKLAFMLRIVAEVYADRELPARIDDITVLDEYLNKKLEKFDRKIGRNCLEEIGNALISAERDQASGIPLLSDRIEESYLRNRLNLKPTDKLPVALFAYNLLTRVEAKEGLQFIGFYYTRIRDYVIAVLSLKLPSKKDDDFEAVIPSLFESSMGQSVLSWYINVARESQKKILLEHRQTRALLFLKEYVRIIETHFPLMKDRFEPFTTGEIGIVISNDQTDIKVAYGFRPLHKADDKVLEGIPVPIDQELLPKLNVNAFKWKSKDFNSTNPLIAAREEVNGQLKEIITNGALNEDYNIGLALEKTIAIIHNNVKILGLPKAQSTYWLPDIRYLLPLKCDDILRKVKLIQAREFYQHETIEQIIKSKMMQTRQNGSHSFQIEMSQLNYDDIDRKANKAVEDGIDIPAPRLSRNPTIYEVLSNAIITVKKEYAEISATLLPPPDITKDDAHARLTNSKDDEYKRISNIVCAQYSSDQLKKYIKVYFETFFKEYKTLIEICFPTIKDKIPFYSEFPSGVYVEVINNESGSVLYYDYKYDNSEPQIDIVINPPEPCDPFSKYDRFRSWHMQRLSSIFLASQTVPYSGLNDSSANWCPLRDFTYKAILPDMDVILQAVYGINKEAFGV